MRWLAAAFLLLLCPALVLAADADASPPSVPQGAGPVAVRAVLANGSLPVGMPVTILASSGSSSATYRLITGREGGLLLQLGEGDYAIGAVLDDMASPGADYASSAMLSVPGERNLTITFYPAGSMAVAVMEGGRAVPGAEMHASCSSDWFDIEAVNGGGWHSGEAGDFLFRALPAGTCVVSASTSSSAGSAQVAVEHGKLSNAQIEMKPKAFSLPEAALLLGAAVIILAAAYFAIARMKPAQAPEAAQRPEEPKRQAGKKQREAPAQGKGRAPAAPKAAGLYDSNGETARAVLGTLSEREAEIVRFLMACGGKAKRSAMQHKLLIPKTSLLRNLRALERKNIVKLIPFGRNLVAELNRSLFE